MGRGSLVFCFITIITLATIQQLLILALLLYLLMSCQAQLYSELPHSAQGTRFHCATLCPYFP